jgi:pimeloyl-ACP methyl ester carboxylesterase
MTVEDRRLSEQVIQLPRGPRLAVRVAKGEKRPFLLVHGLASNALMWELVSDRLASLGHEVVSVDLRGHGRSERPENGYSTAQASADLEQLIDVMGWGAARRPICGGQSWGGNVVLHLAAHTDALHGVAAVDGGWIHLAERFPTFDECWEQLAPPDFGGTRWEDVRSRLSQRLQGWPDGALAAVLGNLEESPDGVVRNRLARAHHRSIVHSLWADDPADYYPRVTVPSLFLVAGDADTAPEKAATVARAAKALGGSRVRWYPGAHHDLHLQHPHQVAVDLQSLLDPQPQGADAP